MFDKAQQQQTNYIFLVYEKSNLKIDCMLKYFHDLLKVSKKYFLTYN